MIGGIHYLNDGDWVESCTALVEHFDGHFEIINWKQENPAVITETPDDNTATVPESPAFVHLR
jgi:hypothetical protein